MGHEWNTEWRATSSSMPLPPLSWYAPVGTNSIKSEDGHAIWINAQIRVACWIWNALDVIVRHYDPIGYSGTVQPCDGTRPGRTAYAEYDPYDPEPYDGDCYDPTSSGGGGTGIQFQPGDYTNGETVDWNTGTGNGGMSECGAAAKVEYTCIDVWNDKNQRWDTFSCGFATTC